MTADVLVAAPAVWVVLGLVAAALVAEDAACVSAGVLVGAGGLDPWPAVGGCFAGILAGDLAAWAVGRSGRRAVADRYAGWVRSRAPAAIVAARFLPGARVPLHLAAGAARVPTARFLTWAVVAAAVWAPLFVLSVALVGPAVADALGAAWLLLVGVVAALVLPRLFVRRNRQRVVAAVSRVWRWEFWPAWLFYLPLAPWYVWLAARHRGATVWTAVNPGIPAGGVVGESKADILAQLDSRFVAPTVLVPPGELRDRLRAVLAAGWEFPLILKPDAGQRGAGVRRAHDAADVAKYLAANPAAVVAQPYHPGPFEAGVFYYRLPGEARGQIFSVTDKVFPAVVGDGSSTLADLVWAHPRYRMQASVFLARHDGAAVPAAGERVPLATAGNHCQGALFRDGADLATPELAAALDEAVRPFPGFCFGRFDIRYADPAELRAGRGFAVIELNGATSESTNLYDPTWPLGRAYRVLFRQWALAFRIGAANRARGHRPVGVVALLRLVRDYYRDRTVSLLAD